MQAAQTAEGRMARRIRDRTLGRAVCRGSSSKARRHDDEGNDQVINIFMLKVKTIFQSKLMHISYISIYFHCLHTL